MNCKQHKAMAAVVQRVIQHGTAEMATIDGDLVEIAMGVEPEIYLGAGTYERTSARRADRHGAQPKRLDTPAGSVTVSGPKTAGHPPGEPFYPQALERGRRATATVHEIAAPMLVAGVSTRQVEPVLPTCGVESDSTAQTSRAVQQLEAHRQQWRERSLGEDARIIVDARYEKVRMAGPVQSVAVRVAVGLAPDGGRRILGYTVAPTAAEAHWHDFFTALVARGWCGVTLVVSDCHADLRKAIQTAFPTAAWQRCQFHITRNARQRAPNRRVRNRIGQELRDVWNRPDRATADATLLAWVGRYLAIAPAFARGFAAHVPDGLRVFAEPAAYRRPLRTTNMLERAVPQELKRRTQPVRSFSNVAALEPMVTPILFPIDEKWVAEPHPDFTPAGQNESFRPLKFPYQMVHYQNYDDTFPKAQLPRRVVSYTGQQVTGRHLCVANSCHATI